MMQQQGMPGAAAAPSAAPAAVALPGAALAGRRREGARRLRGRRDGDPRVRRADGKKIGRRGAITRSALDEYLAK